MKPYKTWKNLTETEMTEEQHSKFWNEYLAAETTIYENILKTTPQVITGTIEDLSKQYNVDEITFTGFLDGINSSLKTELNLDKLSLNTEFSIDIDYESLYYNMHEAKAKWLYNIKHWEKILTNEKRRELKKKYQSTKIIVKKDKIGRNDPCHCGSGKKYKKCCLSKDELEYK